MGLKPLAKEIKGVKVLSDCGMGLLHKNSKNKVRLAMVECTDCGEARKVNIYAVSKLCPSCSNKGMRNGAYKHGENRKNRCHNIWSGIKSRCNSPTNKDYKSYGGRGIRVCKEWEDYETFAKWAEGRFENSEMSIERIDVEGDYESSNCMILPTYLQAYNRRNGIDFKTAVAFAKEIERNLKVFGTRTGERGYIMRYMDKFNLKDYQVKQFALYSKHTKELATYE